jgi:drug/metabolite transporter (DMT)-like permease
MRNRKLPEHWLGIAAVATVMVVFGTTFVAIKIALMEMEPLTLAFGRFLIALILFAPFLGRRREDFVEPFGYAQDRLSRDGVQAWQLAAMGLLGVTLFFALQNWGLVYTSAANAAIVLSAIPALTAIVGRVALGEPVGFMRGLGILLSMAGVAVVVTGGSPGGSYPAAVRGLGRSSNLLGDLLVLGAALCWALYTVLGRRVVARLPHAVVTAHTIAWGTLFLAPLAVGEILLQGVSWPSARGWAALLFLAVAASGLAFFLYLFALTRLKAGEASVYVNLSPVVTLVAARLVLAEPITLLQLVGAALVLSGVYLSERGVR